MTADCFDALKSKLKVEQAPLLFLDYDGVLHPHDVRMSTAGPRMSSAMASHALFEHVHLLALMLSRHPDVRLVLSTNWVPLFGFDYAVARLPPALQDRVIGATFDEKRDHAGYLSVARGHQVVQDAKRRKAKRWIGIDDAVENWPASHMSRLVASHPVLGLGDAQVRESLELALAAV